MFSVRWLWFEGQTGLSPAVKPGGCPRSLGERGEQALHPSMQPPIDREPVTIVSKPVYGPRFSVGMLALVALFAFGLGIAAGGIILPFSRASAPVDSGSVAPSRSQGQSRQVLVSILPQTILAELDRVNGPVSTNLSIEQYLDELEVRASQAGFTALRSVRGLQGGAEISYEFKPEPREKVAAGTMPETLVLRFESGPQAGTLVMTEMRRDGVVQSAGMRFADLVRAGATLPDLSETQLLTSLGLIEIRTIDARAAAYLDGVLIYPREAVVKGKGEALLPDRAGGDGKVELEAATAPRSLSIQAVWPAGGRLPEAAVLVAGGAREGPCSARVIVLDLRRATRIILAERLQTGVLDPRARERGLALGGFCLPASRQGAPGGSKDARLQPLAFYDVRAGQLRWETAPAAQPKPPVAMSVWRELSTSRIASPLGWKGALASVACRAGGGYTIAVSGLPGPEKGNKGSVLVRSGGRTASLVMSWKPSANGYETEGAAEVVAADPFLARLGAGQPLEFASNGVVIQVPAPRPDQLESLIARCKKLKPL